MLLGVGRSVGDSESEGDSDNGIEMPPLPVKGEVEETPLGPAVVGKSDGPAEPLGDSPPRYEVDPPGISDDCSIPVCPYGVGVSGLDEMIAGRDEDLGAVLIGPVAEYSVEDNKVCDMH